MLGEIKQKWVEALRSGKYEQTRGTLVEGNPEIGPSEARFCCLGVLTDLAIQEGCPNVRWMNGSVEQLVEFVDEDGDEVMDWVVWDDGDLPSLVREWAELRSSNPILGKEAAVTRNDDWMDDFETLACVIERDEKL